MYSELLKTINQYHKVVLLGEFGTGKSQILRLLLTDTDLQEKVVIEEYQEIDFIKRNLKTGQLIKFQPFGNLRDAPEIMINLANEKAHFLAVIDVPFIKPVEGKMSLLTLFKECLSHNNENYTNDQVKRMLKNSVDLMVVFEESGKISGYQFGNSHEMLRKVLA